MRGAGSPNVWRTNLSDVIDKELRAGLLSPPKNFVNRVMAEVDKQPIPAHRPPPAAKRDVVEWLAVAGAVLAGASQLAGLMFGLWTFTTAG